MINKKTIQMLIKEEMIKLLLERRIKTHKIVIKETLDDDDYKEIQDLIRAELAEIFFDLFKKRTIWI